MSRHAPTWSDGTGGGTALGDGAGPATCLPYVLAREAGSLPQYLPHECRRRRPALVPAWPTSREGQGRRRHGGVGTAPEWRSGSLERRHKGSSVLRPSGRPKRPSIATAWREPFSRPGPKPNGGGRNNPLPRRNRPASWGLRVPRSLSCAEMAPGADSPKF